MSISDEDKRRIEEEEKYREEVRQKEKNKKLGQGCLVVLIGAFLIGVCTFALAGNSDTAPEDVPSDAEMQAALDAVMTVSETFNTLGEEQFFTHAAIKENGRRLELTVSDTWYALPDFTKDRIASQMADTYAVIASEHGLRGEKPDASNYPTTSLVDSFGKEVAYTSTLRGTVLR